MVSVIIPAYNREVELKRAVKSVLGQTYQDFEILVIDDFSSIELLPVINCFNDSRIKYIKLGKKGNANVSRNVGINMAKGNYIAMLDSDDEWLPEHLEKKINLIESNNLDGIFGSYYIDDGVNRKEVISRSFSLRETMGDYLLSGGKAATPTQVYKADCVKSVMWDEKLFRHQDYDFSIRFAEKFKFAPSTDLTCIVHWKTGEKRTEHIESQLLFMKKHGDKLKPSIYNHYFSNLYNSMLASNEASVKFKEYAKTESTRYIDCCSLVDFLSIEGIGKDKLFRFFLRFKYCFKVLIS